jgi:hypothetical protein
MAGWQCPKASTKLATPATAFTGTMTGATQGLSPRSRTLRRPGNQWGIPGIHGRRRLRALCIVAGRRLGLGQRRAARRPPLLAPDRRRMASIYARRLETSRSGKRSSVTSICTKLQPSPNGKGCDYLPNLSGKPWRTS